MRIAENKAKVQQSGGLGLTELGKKVSDCIGHQVFTYKKREQINTYSMKLLEIVESFV